MAAEDPQATRPYSSSILSVTRVKSYVKSWRHWTTAASDTASITTNTQGRGFSKVFHRYATQKAIQVPSSEPTERVHLFPGWAVRQYVDAERKKFNLHVHISGYATVERPSRGQRAFVRLAKGYAALHKLAETHTEKSSIPDSTCLGHSRDDSKEEEMLQQLDESFRQAMETAEAEMPELAGYSEDSPTEAQRPDPSNRLHRWHTNIEERLRFFLDHSMLPSRQVHLEFSLPQHRFPAVKLPTSHTHLVIRETASTGEDGMFQHDFVISWEDLQRHNIADRRHGDQTVDHELILHATVLPTNDERRRDIKAKEYIPITDAPIRVISDIDDTIKISDIVGGARAIFRNVFVHDLEHTAIPDMAQWYTNMWKRGVRFHYVSNGPVQLLPLVKMFLQTSNLPSGSIRLKSYAARSIFNDLLTPPADRKRDGLEKIFEAFPDSKFILIGDTGEQDLELYAQIAELKPDRVLAILVRDVDPSAGAIPDPIGKDWKAHNLRKNSMASSSTRSSLRKLSLFSTSFSATPAADEDAFGARESPITTTYVPEHQRAPNSDNVGKTRPIRVRTSTKSSWFPSTSPGNRVSSSPLAALALSPRVEEEADMPSSPKSNGAPSLLESDEHDYVLMEGPRISQSPEPFGVPKLNMSPSTENRKTIGFVPLEQPLTRSTSASSAIHASMRTRLSRPRNQTADGAGLSYVSSARPRTPRQNTTGSGSPVISPSIISLTSNKYRGMSDGEKKRMELQERVWRARAMVPEDIVLRIFKNPADCVDVEELLKKGGL